jgi:hypothetical protein
MFISPAVGLLLPLVGYPFLLSLYLATSDAVVGNLDISSACISSPGCFARRSFTRR